MNWLLFVVIFIIAFFMVQGYKKGLLRTLYSLVAWLVILLLVSAVTPYVSDVIKNKTSLQEKFKEQSITYMEGETHLPDQMEVKLGDAGKFAQNVLDESGVYEKAAEKLSGFAIDGVVFVLSLLIAVIAFHLISQVIGVVDHIPVLNGTNRLFGVCTGFINGTLVVWAAFTIVALAASSTVGKFLISYISEAPLLEWLYQNNIILIILLHFL